MKKLFLLHAAISALCLSSMQACSKDGIDNSVENTENIFVPQSTNLLIKPNLEQLENSDAELVAMNFAKKQFGTTKSAIKTRAGDTYSIIKSEQGSVVAYAINFEGGGFAIISATKKNAPILAYSDAGEFNLDEAKNNGTAIWMSDLTNSYEQKELSEDEQIQINMLWAEYEDYSMPAPLSKSSNDQAMYEAFEAKMYEFRAETEMTAYPIFAAQSFIPTDAYNMAQSIIRANNASDQYSIIEIVGGHMESVYGPYLETEWGQGNPHNAYIPNGTPTGCVATTMAQIMMYHKHPSNYDWAKMEGNSIFWHQDDDILMRDIGIHVDMNYTTTGSSSNIFKAQKAFTENFDYTTRITGYGVSGIEAELKYKRPMYIRGASQSGGHAWVLDGYRKAHVTYSYYVHNLIYHNGEYKYTTAMKCGGSSHQYYPYYHFNWGFDGSSNGWYRLGNLSPTNDYPGDSFSQDMKVMFVFPNK